MSDEFDILRRSFEEDLDRVREGKPSRYEFSTSGAIKIDVSGAEIVISRQPDDVTTIKREIPTPEEVECCPDESPWTADDVWPMWIAGRGRSPRGADNWVRTTAPWPVVANTVGPGTAGFSTHKFCVRFFWICSCSGEAICKHAYIAGSTEDLLTEEEYLNILRPYVLATPCVSQLYAIEFFGSRQSVDDDYIYTGGSTRYVIYRLAAAPIG